MAQFTVSALVDFGRLLSVDEVRRLHKTLETLGGVATFEHDDTFDCLLEFSTEGSITTGWAGGVMQQQSTAASLATAALVGAGFNSDMTWIVGLSVQLDRPPITAEPDSGLVPESTSVVG